VLTHFPGRRVLFRQNRNIALIENGKPTLGVVYAPVMKVMYSAEKGKAWKRVDQPVALPVLTHFPGRRVLFRQNRNGGIQRLQALSVTASSPLISR
jgi:hypothetical protein